MKNDLGYSRFAVSVRRAIGSSVERNYIKRVMKELFRLNVGLLKGNYDIWITIQKPFKKKDFYYVKNLYVNSLNSIKKDDKKDN